MHEAINSKLRIEVNDKGQTIARMKQIEGGRRDVIKALNNSNDSLNIRLAALIKEGGRKSQVATIIETVTEVIKEVPVTIHEQDTIYVENTDSIVVMPVYSASYSDEWINYSIKAMHDSLSFRAVYHSRLNMRHEKRRGYTDVFVLEENPYSSVNSVTSWSIKRKPRRFGAGLHIGLGVDSDLRIRPQLGVSVSYHLIQF